MRYSNKITALLLVLTMSSMSLAQGEQLAREDNPDRKDSHLLKAAVVVAGIALIAIGGHQLLKHIDSKAWREAAEKAVREAEKAKKRAEEIRRAEELRIAEEARAEVRKNARKEARRQKRQAERQDQRQNERKAARQAERKKARQNERQAKRERRAEEIHTAEAYTAAMVRKHAAVVERGKALQLEAQSGKKMSAAELRSIYEGRVAALEVERAKKLEAIHKQYPDLYSSEEIATAITQRDEKIAEIEKQFDSGWMRRHDIDQINADFEEKYPKYVAIHKLEDEYQRQLEHWHKIYDVTKNLTDGLPEVKYAPELTSKISAIIDSTAIDTELSALVKLGNLQEVIWKLAEHGFTSEATAMTKLIEDVLMNGEIISKDAEALSIGATKPLLLELSNGLKGVFKGDYGQYDKWQRSYDWPQREIAAYKFDQLLGLNVFPITVPRQIGDYKGGGSIQLFIDAAAGNDFYKQYVSYLLTGKNIPPNSQEFNVKNRTFFALTMDRDIDAYAFNNIKPIAGRLIKIDAEQAFYSLYGSAGEDLLKKPENFYTDADFIERLDNIATAQLEEFFQPLFDPQIAVGIVKGLHTNIRSYIDAARQLHP